MGVPKSGKKGRARAARAARVLSLWRSLRERSYRKYTGRTGRTGPLSDPFDHFRDLLFQDFLDTVIKSHQKPPTKMRSKMIHLARSLAFWRSPPWPCLPLPGTTGRQTQACTPCMVGLLPEDLPLRPLVFRLRKEPVALPGHELPELLKRRRPRFQRLP